MRNLAIAMIAVAPGMVTPSGLSETPASPRATCAPTESMSRSCGSSRRRASPWGRRGATAPGNGIPPRAPGKVRLAIHLALSGNLGLLGSQPVAVDLFVEAAQTEAHLAAIDCADASDPVHRVVVDAEPGLVRLGIGKYPNFDTSPDPVATDLVSLKLLGLTVAKVTAFADVPFQSAGMDLDYEGPFVPQIDEPSEDNTQTIGTPVGDALSTALGTLLGSTQLQVVALGGPLLTLGQKNSALTAVTSKLTPVLTVLDDPLTNLFNALGITVGGADITIVWVGTNQSRDPLGVPSLAR